MADSNVNTLPFRSFETEVYSFTLGQNSQKLNVSADVLVKIPYFKAAIEDGSLNPNAPYLKKEFEPTAFAIVLAYFRDGELKCFELETTAPTDLEVLHRLCDDYRDAWLIAEYLQLETAQNAIMDRLCRHLSILDGYKKVYSLPSTLEAGSCRKTPLYRLFTQQVVYNLRKDFRDPHLASSDQWEFLCQKIGKYNKDELILLVAEALKPAINSNPIRAAVDYPCSFHVHVNTEECGPAMIEEPESPILVRTTRRKRLRYK